MKKFPRPAVRIIAATAIAIYSLISLSTCMEVINEELMLLVADEFAPVLEIESPQFGTSYLSSMAIVGTVIDSSETDGDGKGKLASMTLEFLDWGAFNRTVIFDKDGNVSSTVPDEDFFSYDRETGRFRLEFETVKSSGDSLRGDQYITLIAEDQNGNVRTWETTLVDSAFGPTIVIDEPKLNSNYYANVTVEGRAYDRGSNGASWSEVKSVAYAVSGAMTKPLEDVPLDSNGGFIFTFSTESFNGNIFVEITATDLNGRTTIERLNLLGDQIGPYVDVTTPLPNSSYASQVTVGGTVEDRNPEGTAIEELKTLSWEVSALSLNDEITRDVDGTFTVSPTITLNPDGTFSFSFSTIDYNRSLSIVIVATDLNNRSTTEVISLLGDANGPYLEITEPFNNSYYASTVTIEGLVRNLDSSATDPSTSEVDRLYYVISGTAIENEITGWENDTSAFSFEFPTTSFNNNIFVQIIAVDKNARTTSQTMTFLPYPSGPEVTLTSPQEYGYYRSNISIVGTVRDQDYDPADKTTYLDEVDTVTYQVIGTTISGAVNVERGTGVSDDTGALSASFSTIGERGNLYLVITATDLNGRDTVESIVMNDYLTGPELVITDPPDLSEFKSSVTVTGMVNNQNVSGIDTSEVKRISYNIPLLGIPETTIWDAGQPETNYDSSTGVFNFTFDTTGKNFDFSTYITAVDLNNRETEERLDLRNDDRGPYIEVISPGEEEPYRFTVNIEGNIRNEVDDDGLSEIASLRYKIPAKGIDKALTWGTDPVNFPDEYGVFTDTIIIPPGTIGPLAVTFTATDLNGNVTEVLRNLLDTAPGPQIEFILPERYLDETEKYYYAYDRPLNNTFEAQALEPEYVQWEVLSYKIISGDYTPPEEIIPTENIDEVAGTFSFMADFIDITGRAGTVPGDPIEVSVLARDEVGRQSTTTLVFWDDSEAPLMEMEPTIDIAADNSYIDVHFSEGVWTEPYKKDPLTVNDFELILNKSFDDNADYGPGADTIGIDAVTRSVDSDSDGIFDPLAGGELDVRLWITVESATGVVGFADGLDTIDIGPLSMAGDGTASIYDKGSYPVENAITDAALSDTKPPFVRAIGFSINNPGNIPRWPFVREGFDIEIILTFNEIVAVQTTGGVPRILLNTLPAAYANYSSGSGTKDLTFIYTVGSDHNSAALDMDSSSIIDLNGGTIKDVSSNLNAAVLDLSDFLGDLGVAAVKVDTVAPSIVAAETADNDGDGRIDRIHVTFDEPIDGDDPANPLDTAQFQVTGYTVSGVDDEGDGADNETIGLSMTEDGYDTEATPDVISQVNGISDLAGNTRAVAQTYAATVDKAAPVIRLIETVDSNVHGEPGHGFIDSLKVSFSEPVNASSMILGSFSIDTGLVSAVSDDGTSGDDTVYVRLTDGVLLTDIEPHLTVQAGGIADFAGVPNTSQLLSSIPSVDKAPPVLVGLETRDTNDDGKVNRLVATYNENVNASTINPNAYSTDMGSVSGVVDDLGNADPKSIWVELPDGLINSDQTPRLTATAGAITDTQANATAYMGYETSLDRAPAVLSEIVTVDSGAFGDPGFGFIEMLIVTFNENVSYDAFLDPDKFALDMGTGVAVVDYGGSTDTQIAITLNEGELATDQTPELTLAATGIRDLADNYNITQPPLTALDGAAPVLDHIHTADTDNNGNVDRLILTYNEDVDAGTIQDLSFYYIDTGRLLNVTDNGAPFDKVIWFEMDELAPYTLNTDQAPQIGLYAEGIADLAGNLNIIQGLYGAEDKAPAVISQVTTTDQDGDGHIDLLTVTFNENVDSGTINAGQFALSAGTRTGVIDGPGSNSVNITLTDGELTTAPDQAPTVTVSAGAINDAAGNFNVDQAGEAAVDTAGPAILSAVADDGTAIYVGVDSDDSVTITFSEPTNTPLIDSSNIDTILPLSNGHTWLNGDLTPAIAGALWNSSSELVIYLSDTGGDPTILEGDTITITAGNIWDMPAGNPSSTQPSPGISGRFCDDEDTPDLVSISTQDNNGDGYVDRLVVLFDEPVNETTLNSAGFTISAGNISSVGTDGVTDNAIIWINLVVETVVGTGDTPTVTIPANAIEDLPGNKFEGVSGYATTDTSRPILQTLLTDDSDGDGFTDTLIATFNEGMAPVSADAGDFTVTGGGNVTAIEAGGSAEEVLIRLTHDFYDTGARPALTISGSGITDDATPGNQNATVTGLGATDAEPPLMMSAGTADLDGNGLIDAIHVVYSEAMSDPLDATGFDVAGFSNEGFNTGSSASDADFYITFDENGSYKTDHAPNFTYDAGTGTLSDFNGVPALSDGRSPVEDNAGPAILSAAASDGADLYVVIDADDTVTVTFSEATNEPAIGAGNIDSALSLNNGHSWLDDGSGLGSAVWSAPDTLVVTLLDVSGGLPDIAVGDTITAGSVITDEAVPANTATSIPFGSITGTFSADNTPPTLASVTTKDSEPNGTVDQLVFVFDEPVDETSITLGGFTLDEGSVDGVADDGNDFDDTVWFTVSGIPHTGVKPVVDIAAGAIYDKPGNAIAGITGFNSTVDGAAPRMMNAETVDRDGNGRIDAVLVTYSEAVDDSTIDANASDFTVAGLGSLGFTSTTGGLDTADNEVIYITFGEDDAFMTDARPNFSYAAGSLKDLAGLSAVTNDFGQPVDSAGPAILTAEAFNTGGTSGKAGDEVVIVFSEATNEYAVSAVDIDTVLALGGNSWLDGDLNIGSAGWNTGGDTLTVTLSGGTSDPSVSVGDTITVSGAITDGTNMATAVEFSAITGTFSAPTIIAASTGDADSDGYIDFIRVTFNKPVDGSTADKNKFYVDGVKSNSIDAGSGAEEDDEHIRVLFNDAVSKTDYRPELDVYVDAIYDLDTPTANGNAAYLATAEDGAPAIIESAETGDLNENGYIDTISITLSEAITDSTVYAIGFRAEELYPQSFDTGAGSDDNVIHISFYEDDDYRTDATPDVTISSGAFEDSNGVAAASFTFSGTADKAGPQILSVVWYDAGGDPAKPKHNDQVVITWSEALNYNTSSIAESNVNDVLVLSNGHTWIGTAWEAEGFVNQNALVMNIRDGGTDPVANLVALGDTLHVDTSIDYNGNSIIRDTSLNETTEAESPAIVGSYDDDGDAPTVIAVTTGDSNSDGFIDYLQVEFDEPVDDDTADKNIFYVGGVASTAVSTGLFPNDKYLRAHFADGVSGTATTPSYRIDNAGIRDLANVSIVDTGTMSDTVDNAPAVLISATATDSDGSTPTWDIFDGENDSLTLTFSEEIDDYSTADRSAMEANLYFGYGDVDTSLPDIGTVVFSGATCVITAGAGATAGSPLISIDTADVPVAIVGNLNLKGDDNIDVAVNVILNGLALPRRILLPTDTAKAEFETQEERNRPYIPDYPEYVATRTVAGKPISLATAPRVTWSDPSPARSVYRSSYSVLDLLGSQNEGRESAGVAMSDGTSPANRPVSIPTDVTTLRPKINTAVKPGATQQSSPADPTMQQLPNIRSGPAPQSPARAGGADATAAAQPIPETAATTAKQKPADRWFLITLFALGVLAPVGYLGLRRRRSR